MLSLVSSGAVALHASASVPRSGPCTSSRANCGDTPQLVLSTSTAAAAGDKEADKADILDGDRKMSYAAQFLILREPSVWIVSTMAHEQAGRKAEP